MQFTFILLLLSCLSVSAKSFAQGINISGNHLTLHEIFKEVRAQTDYNFIYSNENIVQASDVSISANNASINEVLRISFANQPLSYKIDGKMIVVKRKPAKPTQTSTHQHQPQPIDLTGAVIDSTTGQPLIGVSIKVKGSLTGTITDAKGHFSLTVPEDAILIVSSLGYGTKTIPVDGRTQLQIMLSQSSTALEQLVVTALGIKESTRKLGYAVQKVQGDALQTVEGVDVATSLTGKVSGLVIRNSTEFGEKPSITLRGESPLLVINGVPYENVTLRDIPTDNIKSISVLKGPTAAALYGSRGASGAIMITTKSGKGSGLSINISSNTMTRLGFLKLPKVQTDYAHGLNGKIATDYVWGPKLDIGDSARQWNPMTKQWEMRALKSRGEHNLKNFMRTSVITNNNINVTQSGENGYFRASLNHIYNKGQYPNTKLNILNYTMGGELKIGNKFTLESHMGYTLNKTPQTWGSGYGDQGYIYQILMWTGPDYDIRNYRDYWVVPNVKQNWLYTSWYDNPYLIAYEKLVGHTNNKLHASLTANYNFNEHLNLMFRTGYDYYKNETTIQNPAGVNSTRGGSAGRTFGWSFSGKGSYGMDQLWGFSTNNDLILTYDNTFGNFNLNALGGASVSYFVDREQGARTRNGLAIPGWYSLANAVPSTTAGVNSIINNYGTWRKQVNSLYGKFSGSWKDMVYLTLTGRNDWSSTQSAAHRSYFYPSISSSVVLSQFITMPHIVDFLKVRGSWTQGKIPAGIYSNNRTFGVGTSWGLPSASYPSSLSGTALLPSATRTWEVGLAGYLFNRRLHLDVAYFRKYYYNQQESATISAASGFTSTRINTKETYARRGLEITVDGSIIKTPRFEWHSMLNYSFQHRYYVTLDPTYSPDNLWTKVGKRLDVFTSRPYLRGPEGQIIHVNGFRKLSDYEQVNGYTDPDFSFGFINHFTLGDFSLNISIDGRIGGIMYAYMWNKMFDTGANPETVTKWRYDEVVNGLTNFVGDGIKVVSGKAVFDKYGRIIKDTRKYAPNDVAVSYQAYQQSLNDEGYEHGLKDQSFIKLREISVAYHVPNQFVSKLGLSSASLAITGQNVAMWTKFPFADPDVGSTDMNSPSQRMLGFSIKVGL